jgi:hypothetical protein
MDENPYRGPNEDLQTRRGVRSSGLRVWNILSWAAMAVALSFIAIMLLMSALLGGPRTHDPELDEPSPESETAAAPNRLLQ